MSRVSLSKGSTAFFMFIFLSIELILFTAAEESFKVKCFSYSAVCLFSFVCVGGAGSFFKLKINNEKLKNTVFISGRSDITHVIVRACSWQSLTNLFRDCFVPRNDVKTEKCMSLPDAMLKQGWHDSRNKYC
ncbi:hypothetical protein KRX57_06570 [Weeksellaceae bacterium TAE3-ERU29]|nr:hypothetical protein [Weeksellaceae bacterium TAE3-ERU29]